MVDGKFKDSQSIQVSQYEEFDSKENLGTFSERWEVIVPSDGQDTHQFRLQLPENVKKASIYVKTNGDYEKMATTSMGMYQLFDVDGERASILVIDETTPLWEFVVCGIAVLLIIGITVITIVEKNKKKKPAPSKATRKERKEIRKKKSKQARKVRKEKLETGLEKAQQLIEEAKDDSPRGER